jgi:hypothetical protein
LCKLNIELKGSLDNDTRVEVIAVTKRSWDLVMKLVSCKRLANTRLFIISEVPAHQKWPIAGTYHVHRYTQDAMF